MGDMRNGVAITIKPANKNKKLFENLKFGIWNFHLQSPEPFLYKIIKIATFADDFNCFYIGIKFILIDSSIFETKFT